MDMFTTALTWFAAISSGIMAGVYLTFSVFVMRSLDAMAGTTGMAAMQSINRIILKSAFMPLFFLSSLASLVLAIGTALDLADAGAIYLLAGGAIYVLGMFGVTAAGNVPLNDRLEATDSDGSGAAAMWSLYMRRWTVWNHVRSIACTTSAVLFTLALIARA
ncbi:DUF1772 domain-containing protein [Sphingomicrobium sediminis]|uniref:DUF1772 domain-containing protein n=1 Tax=Sphingomicrobium sediminis TaxID=2950949 RepID=A0A9X2EK23_9SPHN|nr:anthrone oxygenase family protein [Sphingomicrobium sediminis]MCM8558271.1 DUF1772 domain-containing protein [Sphingomicrobium sediminis]